MTQPSGTIHIEREYDMESSGYRVYSVKSDMDDFYVQVSVDPEPVEVWAGEPCSCGHNDLGDHVVLIAQDENGDVLDSVSGVCAFEDEWIVTAIRWNFTDDPRAET